MRDTWTPVTSAAGETLGWMAPADPDEPDVDYFDADRPRRTACRAAIVKARADRINPVADVAGDEAFTAEEVTDMGRGAGLSDDDLDAAANVAVALWEIEQLRR